MKTLRTTLCCTILIASILASAAAAITIDTVPVGNPGNAGDTAVMFNYGTSGHGSVAYNYRIGTTEVTVGQYTAFLNAVAATDTYLLYNPLMATDLNIVGISRSGASGSYSYSVMGSPDHPVTYVSWGDAARFSNWLHNGQPTGAQNASTTEDGAYPLNGATSIAALAVSRNAGAQWFIPTVNESYKAAYHQPAAQGGDADNYWAYPTRTNSEPNSDQPPGDPSIQTNVANFNRYDGIANGYNDGFAVTGSTIGSSIPNYLTDAGAYASATSPYGTFDQGGNVHEWNETLYVGSRRGVSGGGAWNSDSFYLLAISAGDNNPTNVNESDSLGFRVASIPEPGTWGLLLVGGGGLFLAKRHRRRKSARNVG